MKTMQKRKVRKAVRGQFAIDGAGVRLVRVLGGNDVEDFDPFLMLDSFDSTDPDDYIRGFPLHPHRGIETITYLIEGEIQHQDSLGNTGTIKSGEGQWMTAGSGILHQEMPQAMPRMLGLQVWLNLHQPQKMIDPTYFDIRREMIAVAEENFGTVRVISGKYKDVMGIQPPHWRATMYDVSVSAGKEAVLPTNEGENVFIFLIEGDADIDGHHYTEKTAVLFDEGDSISVKTLEGCRFIFFSGKKLHEPISWGGPIVMNTRRELQQAYDELNHGTFIKHKQG